MHNYLILAINPGSTSTKLAIYRNLDCIHEKTIQHDAEIIASMKKDVDKEITYRKQLILDCLNDWKIYTNEIDCFVGRGGLLRPIKGGVYAINEKMIDDLKNSRYEYHASNLGALLAYELAIIATRPSFIVNPVVVDEMTSMAKLTGFKLIERRSAFHALNQKAVAKRYAKLVDKKYEDLNLIVCHLGGGISVGYHQHGLVVDVNNPLGGDGTFSPDRAGSIPSFPLIDLCFSGKYTKSEIKNMLVGHGGLYSYLQETNVKNLVDRILKGDSQAKFYVDGLIYKVAKEIGGNYFIANGGKIDALIITGGIAYSDYVINQLKQYIPKNINLQVFPGENEMQALVEGAYDALLNKEEVKKY